MEAFMIIIKRRQGYPELYAPESFESYDTSTPRRGKSAVP
jgi:hypothetical protein